MLQSRQEFKRLACLVTLALMAAGCSGESGTLPPGDPDFSESDLQVLVGGRALLFGWEAVQGATHYKLFENPDGASGFTQLQPTIPVGGVGNPGEDDDLEVEFIGNTYTALYSINVHLQDWDDARYMLESCRADDTCTFVGETGAPSQSGAAVQFVKATTASFSQYGYSLGLSEDGQILASGAIGETTIEFDEEGQPAQCFDEDEEGNPIEDEEGNPIEIPCPQLLASGTVLVFDLQDDTGEITAFLKAFNADEGDGLGWALDITEDGGKLVTSAVFEDSNSIDTPGNDDAESAGAAYVFSKNVDGIWPLPGDRVPYLKASNAEALDFFGAAVSISGDGSRIAIAATSEDSNATGIDGDQDNNDAEASGAVYVFRNLFGNWEQEAYIKASNTDAEDFFGQSLTLNHSGDLLVVGAPGESSADATDQSDNSKNGAGAVYVFTRDGEVWSQTAFIKASNADAAQQSGDIVGDQFGASVALSEDSSLLLIGAPNEDSIATGIDGDQSDNSIRNAGAAYLFSRNGNDWAQTVYIKASNTGQLDEFGSAVTLNKSGDAMLIAARRESSSATGINGTQNIDNVPDAGATYYFENSMGTWQQKAFVKASVRGFGLQFGWQLAMAEDGDILAISTPFEDTFGTDSGAVFLY
jgi:hypothetical protein